MCSESPDGNSPRGQCDHVRCSWDGSRVGPAATHEKEAEMFFVMDGGGTLVTGGKLVGETRTNAENLSGTAIDGGKSQAVAKGDFFIVPENTPHWFSKLDGTLVLMSVHVPRSH